MNKFETINHSSFELFGKSVSNVSSYRAFTNLIMATKPLSKRERRQFASFNGLFTHGPVSKPITGFNLYYCEIYPALAAREITQNKTISVSKWSNDEPFWKTITNIGAARVASPAVTRQENPDKLSPN